MERRPSLNNDFRREDHTKHCQYVSTVHGDRSSEVIVHTKASVDHSCLIIAGEKTKPSTADRCLFGMGTDFLHHLEHTKASVDHPSIMISKEKTIPSTANMCPLCMRTVFGR